MIGERHPIRYLVGGGDPDATPDIPAESEFKGRAYMSASDLHPIVGDLIEKYSDLRQLQNFELSVLWKREGGKSKGRLTYGGVTIANDLHRLGVETDAFVWVAADHLRQASGFTAWHLEALLYSTLCRLQVTLDKDDKEKLVVVGPEFEGFFSELDHYGAWNRHLQAAQQKLTTMPMFADDDELIATAHKLERQRVERLGNEALALLDEMSTVSGADAQRKQEILRDPTIKKMASDLLKGGDGYSVTLSSGGRSVTLGDGSDAQADGEAAD